MKKKKTEKKFDLTKHDPLKPVPDLSLVGSDLDPCFGKGYDLSTKECKQCGDSELCCLKMSQLLGKTRKELEESNMYKDLDILEDVYGIKKYMRKLKREGNKRRDIITSASKKFEVPSNILRKLYREIK